MKKVLLKLSGEALKNKGENIIDPAVVNKIAVQIKYLYDNDFLPSIVIGAGNIWRGATAELICMDRAKADYMGMMATIINCVALQDALTKLKLDAIVMTSLEINKVAEPFIRRNALQHMENKKILLFAGGTGSPFFSTDSCASLRAAELEIPTILMAKNGTNGVYDSDPTKNSNAKFFEKITYQEIIEKNLRVIDLTAATLAKENKIEMIVFDMLDEQNIKNFVKGKKIGTTVSY